MSNLDKVKNMYDKICEYEDVEDDRHILQTINSTIGWINCLKEYNIEPTEEDLQAITELYNEANGDFDHLGV